MKFKSTIVLAAIFIGLIFYVVFYEVIGEKKRTAEREEKNKVFHFHRDSIATITVERPDIKMTFEKRENNWWLIAPVNYKANNMNVNSLISQMEIAENEGTIAETGEDSVSFGLGPPKMKLYLVLKNGEKDSLFLGDKTQIRYSAYARKSNTGTIFLTNYVILDNMIKDLMEYREKKILEINKSYANRIVLTYPNRVIDLVRTGFKEWDIRKPIKDRADFEETLSILDKFDYAEVKKFIDKDFENLKKYGLDKPKVKMDVFFEKEVPKLSLLVGTKVRKEDAQEGEVSYYAKNEAYDPIITIDSSIVNKLNPNLFTLRNKSVVSFKSDTVEKIVLDYKDSVFVCVKDTADNWVLGEDMKLFANTTKIDDIITQVLNIKTLEFLDYNKGKFSQYGLDKPRTEFVFKTRDDKEIERLAIGKFEGDRVYLINKTKKRIYLIKSESFYNLKFKRSELIKQEEETQV